MFVKEANGFWRQTENIDFEYTVEYRNKQSTNCAMAHLRFGWCLGKIPGEGIKNYSAVDIGAGNCAMEKNLKHMFYRFESYDVVGESISEQELMGTQWDLAFFNDVIEHMEDLEGFLRIPWHYAYMSFPETPKTGTWEELKSWRHFKPGEHIWMLNQRDMEAYLRRNSVEVIMSGHPEDAIRVGQYVHCPNISSILAYRRAGTHK